MGIDYNKFKGASAQKSLENQATASREAQGSAEVGYGIFDFSDAPYPVKKWEPKKGKNVILILPVEVTNKQNPAFYAGAIGLGEYDYGVSAFTHMGKGTVAGVSHVCLKRNYGKKCPRCEEFFLPPEKGGTFVKGVKGSGNSDHASSERNYFLVVPFDVDGKTPDEDGVGIWNSPANSRTGFPVVDRAKEMADGASIIPFWWPTDEGRLVSFEMLQEAGEYPEYKAIKFLKRDTKKIQELADKYSFPLDKYLIVKTADQITEDMFGGPEREVRQDSGSNQEPDSPSEEETRDPDAFGEPEHKDEPEESVPEETKSTSDSRCPYGHSFGTDWGDTPDCKKCRKEHKDVEADCTEEA